MTGAQELLSHLQSLGVRLSADGARLRVNAATGQLSDDLKAQIANQKESLLKLLPGQTVEQADGTPTVAAGTVQPTGRYEVSFAQRRLWFLDRLEPDSIAYHLGAKYPFAADVDVPALEASINDVIERQAALRTVFVEVDGEPFQVVEPFSPRPLMVHDLSALPEAERSDALNRLTLQEATRPFDLAGGPLLRVALVRVTPEAHVLLYTVHHIVCDGWSLGIFLAELGSAYEARRTGTPPALRPLARHYAPLAAAERQRLTGATIEPLVDYWHRRLLGAPPILELPLDRPRPSRRSFSGANAAFALPAALSDALRTMARGERATLYMVLLALFKVLLFRLSGQGDIVIGTPVANRPTPDHESLVGLFVSTLPVRSQLTPELTLRQLVAQVRDNVIEDQAHGELPFEKMVDELRPERSLAVSPIFQVVFALQNTPLASAFEVTTVASMYDLSLFMWDEPTAIRGAFEFSTAILDVTTVKRWCEHLYGLAEAAASTQQALDLPISRLPLMGSALRAQVLLDWNRTARPYERDASLHELFLHAAARSPQAVALRSADPDSEVLPLSQLSYGELARAVAGMAASLKAAGVRRGDPVGLYVERSIGAVVAILAIVAAGGAYVPLDPADPVPRALGILADTQASLVVTRRSLFPHLQGPQALKCLALEEIWAEALAAESPAAASLPPLDGGDLAYVMFTSGTTGKPKGVCVSHRNVARLVCNADYVYLGPEEVLLQFATLAFDAATLEIWGALLNGAQLVVQPRRLPTAGELASTLRAHKVSTLWLTAGMFHHLVEHELRALAEVRQVLAGGDVLSVSHVQRLLDAKLELGAEAGVVINGYGPTENTTFTCCHVMRPGEQLLGTVPIGRPIGNTTVYLLDEHGEPVPPGVPGELHTGGDGVARGYLCDPAATREKFLPDVFSSRPGATLYRTGDMARWRADGSVEFIGRRDRQVKVRGFRIELEEVEDGLRQCPGVRDAAVVTRRDSTGTHILVGYLVPADLRDINHTTIRSALAARLPEYMVPGVLVALASLPLTANGKVDRAALPEPTPVPLTRALVEPRTTVEAQLQAIWERVLGHTGFGVTDNFFELGGHSLLAIRLFAQIEAAFGVKLPVSALFSAPDVERLARRLESEGFSSPWSTLVPIRPEGKAAPLFMVPGIGGNVVCYGEMASHLAPGRPLYGLQSRGLDERDAPFDRIEPMAAHYLAEVRRLQPQGPYHLGGTCFGGVVAYEMAQQLRAAGEEVNTLFLLETWPPSTRRPLVDSLRLRSHQLRFLASAVRRHLAQLRRTPVRDWYTALRARVAIVREMAEKRDVYRGDRASMYVDRVALANQRAMSLYRPRPYDGALRFASAAARRFGGEDARVQWRHLAPRDYAQLDLSARDSGTMLVAPHVEALTRWIDEELAASSLAREAALAACARRPA